MNETELARIAKELCRPGKGILAADESAGTIEKRFKQINLESTENNRKNWRKLLFTTPKINQFLSGVILYDETIRQGLVAGLKKEGIIPGIKVDLGAKPLAGFAGETATEGLDGLRERLAEYVRLGAKFTKWRAVFSLGKNSPTITAEHANGVALAQFAALSQEAGLVPLVEPEILMEGDHSIELHAAATHSVLASVFSWLKAFRVYLPGILLKTNFVASGLSAKNSASAKEVAEATLKVFHQAVPHDVPGIVFLSGGLSPEAATVNLNEINKSGRQPWQLSFSYGRALQGEALDIWQGKEVNLVRAQKVFYDRVQSVALARDGKLL